MFLYVPNYVNEILPWAIILQTVHSKGGPLGMGQASCKHKHSFQEPWGKAKCGCISKSYIGR